MSFLDLFDAKETNTESKLSLKSQSHIHDFGPGRATVHPDLSNRGASA